MIKYTMKDMQKILGVSYPTLSAMISRGDIASAKVGRRTYITEEQYQDYLKRTNSGRSQPPLSYRVDKMLKIMGCEEMSKREQQLLNALEAVLSQ